MLDHVRFQRHLLHSTKFCSMGMFDAPMAQFQNWAGGKTKEPAQKIDPKMGDGNADKGGGGSSGTGNKDPNASGGGNDGGADDALVSKIWQAEQDPNKKDGNNDSQQQQQQQQNQPDPDKQVAEHLDKLGLGTFKLSEQDLEGFKSGDPAVIQASMDQLNARIQNGYLKAVSSANTLIKAQVAKAVEDAGLASKQLLINDKARTALFTEMPWAKDAAIAPVAETVMRKFMEKPGVTVEKAAKLTAQYYRHVQQQMDPDWQPNLNTQGNFRRTPARPDDTDWIGVLKGG